MRQLQRRFAPLQQEIQITSISDIFNFKRHNGESSDEMLSRFDLTVHKAQALGQVGFPEAAKSWMLLTALGIGRHNWPMILAPTQGALPNNPAEYGDFQQYVRRHGHLTDRDTHSNSLSLIHI